MISITFTREDFKMAWDAYFKGNKNRNFESKQTIPAVCGFCAEIALCRFAGVDWQFSYDAADIMLGGLLWQLKSRLESGGGSFAKKTRFNISHGSDYSNIEGFIFSKVHLNADMSGRVELYPDAYDRDWVEENGTVFNSWRMIEEAKLKVCNTSSRTPLESLLQIVNN